MAVKVIIERKIVPGQERQVTDILRQMRARCLDEPGYISGETLRDSENPQTLVVISTWFGLMDWRNWFASADRQGFESRLRVYLKEPEQVRVLLEGLSASLSGA
ncbi:MAG: antibiotic biosynthesis monooxygenase [Dehalococcoidia bacterium]|nr:antibiotic biosynthesis monooxygenase [Dehalococcoidia bacterium]